MNSKKDLKTKTAVVIAGGKGTRLSQIYSNIPKPMVVISGMSVLERIVTTYSGQGIDHFIFTLGYKAQNIIDHFGSGEKWGVRITYFEEEYSLGTAGAFCNLDPVLLGKRFWVFYGDTVSSVDLIRMEQFHFSKLADATIFVHPSDHLFDCDIVISDEKSKIKKILCKPHDSDLLVRNNVNAALYLFESKVVSFIPKNIASDFGRDLFPNWVYHMNFYAYKSSEFLKDMGTPNRIKEVELALNSGKVARRNFREKQKAIFLDRDGVINNHKGLIKSPKEIELIPGVGEALRKINFSDYLAVIITNQSVVARNLIDEPGLDMIHAYLEKLLIENSNSYFDDILYCPHHPDSGYPEENRLYKFECSCRKPKPGLFLEASIKYNINLSESFMVGDSVSDIVAAKAAGCKPVFITNRSSIPAEIEEVSAFQNLLEFVNYLAL